MKKYICPHCHQKFTEELWLKQTAKSCYCPIRDLFKIRENKYSWFYCPNCNEVSYDPQIKEFTTIWREE